jgi:hypothetical protein
MALDALAGSLARGWLASFLEGLLNLPSLVVPEDPFNPGRPDCLDFRKFEGILFVKFADANEEGDNAFRRTGQIAEVPLDRFMLHNSNSIKQVPAQLMRWNRVGGEVVGGLTRRRTAEGQLWNTPVAPVTENPSV